MKDHDISDSIMANNEDMRKKELLKDLASEVLSVQNACNLSGVVHSFSRAVTVMRQDLGMDTPTCNQHPITVMYLDKLNQLAGIQDYTESAHFAVMRAIKAVEEIVRG